MNLLFSLLILFLSFPYAAGAEVISVTTRSIALNAKDSTVVRLGDLVYRGGLVLSSDDSRFGGFSALGVSTDGRRLISLSDQGHRLSAHITYDTNGKLTGLSHTDLSSLAGLDGRVLQSKNESDIESMSPGVEGEIIVSFERNHRLWRYLPGQTTPLLLPPPNGLEKLAENSGIEGLTLLADGRLLALSEGTSKAQNAIGWVSDVSGWSPLTYQLKDGFRVTGAATHPNGDVYVLERYFTLREGVAVRIKRFADSMVVPGAELQGLPVAEFRPPIHLDNFEGIDLRADDDGRVFLYIISDDNFSPLQSTLLMMFEIAQKGPQ